MPSLYYCTHALGPILQIAGDRPVTVTGMETGAKMYPGTVPSDMGAALIKLSSGAIVKLLFGDAVCVPRHNSISAQDRSETYRFGN